MPAFLNPAEAEMWVGVGLLIFLGIVIFVAKAPRTIAAGLDAKSAKIKSDLDEAARLREEAQKLLNELKADRAAAEAQAKEMLAVAQEEARRYETEAKAKLAEQLKRRGEMAERKIANAEAQAAADVKAAAAEMAAEIAEQVLAGRLAATKTDALVDSALNQLTTTKFQ